MSKLIILIASMALIMFSGISYAAEQTQPKASETTSQYLSDSAITTKVKSELLADSDIGSLHISVKTTKHVVKLTGYVATADQKEKAENIAKGIDGVKSVSNHLKIKAKK